MNNKDGSMDRFTICIEKGLLSKLDGIVAERGYPSRSQAMSDFIRRAIVKKEWHRGQDCAGTVSVVYDPASDGPARAVEKLLVKHAASVAASQTVLLKDRRVMLTAAVTGKPADLERLADALRAVKGVTHGSFSITAPLH